MASFSNLGVFFLLVYYNYASLALAARREVPTENCERLRKIYVDVERTHNARKVVTAMYMEPANPNRLARPYSRADAKDAQKCVENWRDYLPDEPIMSYKPRTTQQIYNIMRLDKQINKVEADDGNKYENFQVQVNNHKGQKKTRVTSVAQAITIKPEKFVGGYERLRPLIARALLESLGNSATVWLFQKTINFQTREPLRCPQSGRNFN